MQIVRFDLGKLKKKTSLFYMSDHKHIYVLQQCRETNLGASAAILDYIRSTLEDTPFNFSKPERQARIMSGEEEGLFGWVTANYLTNRLAVVSNFCIVFFLMSRQPFILLFTNIGSCQCILCRML